MCGIAGIFNRDPQAPVSEDALWQMLTVMKNRGPDAQNIWHQPGVGLGHVRLSILDLDIRSNQPLLDATTGRRITFNGEIYNYIELREQLIAAGYTFETSSDTEVILKAYDYWDVDCLNRFNGMWAFAIFDPKTQQLFCARDRLGVKPFVYGITDAELVFASECKTIVSAFPEFNQPNIPFLKQFIDWGVQETSIPTFYEGVYNLLPGHYFIVKPGEVPQLVRYWQWQPKPLEPMLSEEALVEQFKALLCDAIKIRFRSDVPVGVCLSGGLDSSSIVALSSQMSETPVSTFSCVFPEHPEVDESAFIRHITDKFKTNAHFATPEVGDFLSLVKQSVWEQDGPTGGPAVLSQRSVMETAHGKVKVLLDGQGADEILGGYHSYFPLSVQSQLRQLLKRPSIKKIQAYLNATQAIEKRTGINYRFKKSLFKQALKKEAFIRRPLGQSVLDLFNPIVGDDLSTKLLGDLVCWSLPSLLHYEDRNSMAFSIESRLPFLDYRLVEFLFSLPHTYKIKGSRTKFLLFEAVKDLLPEPVLNRKDKMGYATPGQAWFKESGVQTVIQSLIDTIPEPLKNMDQNKLRREWQQYLEGHAFSDRLLWRYMTACFWLEQVAQLKQNPAPLINAPRGSVA